MSIKEFHAGGRLKQAVSAFFTSTLLTQQELEQIALQFRQFDKNGNGVLSRDELIEAYQAIRGINFNEKEIDDLIQKIDVDGSGDINYEEFVNASVSTEKLINEERLEQAFNMFDKDGDRKL